MSRDNIDMEQKAICKQYGSPFLPPSPSEKLGIARNTLEQLPLNALRHPPQSGTSGWYIWGGKTLSQEQDFFEPLHTSHLPRCQTSCRLGI